MTERYTIKMSLQGPHFYTEEDCDPVLTEDITHIMYEWMGRNDISWEKLVSDEKIGEVIIEDNGELVEDLPEPNTHHQKVNTSWYSLTPIRFHCNYCAEIVATNTRDRFVEFRYCPRCGEDLPYEYDNIE